MKILYTLPDLHFGGTSNLLAQTLPSIASKHDVYVVYFGTNETMKQKFKNNQIILKQIRYTGLRDLIKTSISLRKFIKNEKIDIVHSNLILDKLIVGLSIRGMRIRSVATIHSADTLHANKTLKNKIWFHIENFCHNNFFDKIIVVSNAAKKTAIEKRKVNERKLWVLPNGIQKLEPSFTDNFIFEMDSNIILGTACRFQEIKGLFRLLDVFRRLVKELPNLKLILIGDGPLREDLQNKIEDFGLNGLVHITGFSNNVELYLNQIHYYINSSFSEGLPISVLEALSLKKPIIASDVGGLPEIIEEDYNGILVDFKDIDGAAKKIQKFITKFSECYDILQEQSEKSFEKRFSNKIFQRSLFQIYDSRKDKYE